MANSCPICGRPCGGGCACDPVLAAGTVLAGRYELLRLIGRGAAGTVYEARDRELDETVAVKVLDAGDAAAEPARRFRSEIKLARRVNHPSVCRIYDHGQEDGRWFLCMELIEGETLRDRLALRGPFPHEEACLLAIQAAEALQAIHDAGIVHRDVKTENLILDGRGTLHVADFGIATLSGADQPASPASYIVGTPEYMSPEQARGLAVDPRADLYALGIVLFELLTGDVPFRGRSATETLFKQRHEPPPLGALEAAGLPPPLADLLRSVMAKRPEDRPASARELAERLRRMVGVAPGAMAREPGAASRAATGVWNTVTLPTRRRAPAAVAAGRARWIAATLVVAALWANRPGIRTERPSPLAEPPPAGVASTATPARHEVHPPPSVSRPAGGRDTLSLPSPRRPPRPEDAPRPQADPPATAASEPAGARDAGLIEVAEPHRATAEAPPGPAIGHLQLGVAPWAEVVVDGVPLGTTPLRPVPLSAGTHTARIVHPDYGPIVRQVTIRPGETTPLRFDLRLDAIRNP